MLEIARVYDRLTSPSHFLCIGVGRSGTLPSLVFDPQGAVAYKLQMPYILRQTYHFDRWLRRLRDQQAKIRIVARVDRLALGNPGDVRPVGEGISELRIDVGPGYRIYFKQQGNRIFILCGGDKSSQDSDIKKAKVLANDLEGS